MLKANKDIYLILDNVKYAANLGPIFRLADGFGIKKIFLCKGNQEKLNYCQERILFKNSRGATNRVDWEFHNSCFDIVKELKEKNFNIVSVETGENSTLLNKVKFEFPLALVFGSENTGISQDILNLSDEIVKIPMQGNGKSLNVASCVSILAYQAFISCNAL